MLCNVDRDKFTERLPRMVSETKAPENKSDVKPDTLTDIGNKQAELKRLEIVADKN